MKLCLWALAFMTAIGQLGYGQADTPGVHDPCIIKCGDSYYVFATGRGIPFWRSQDLFTWKPAGHVFNGMQPWATELIVGARDHWAPDISLFNGQYHLYYAVSTFGRNRSCIALATNVTLDPNNPKYKWVDHGAIFESQFSDDFNAIDPNVARDLQGQLWMSFGSYWSGIKLFRLDEKTGKRVGDEFHSLAARPKEKSVEAPFIVTHDGWYYLFVSYDQCCQGPKSTYKTMVGRSRAITGPYVDRDGGSMLEGHATLVLQGYDNVRGPGHNAVLQDGDQWYLVHHYYDANENGQRKLHIRPMTWDPTGWPVAGAPLSKPADTKQP